MKVESLVIVDQHATVNLYLGLVLPARHAPGVEWLRSLINPLSDVAPIVPLWCAALVAPALRWDGPPKRVRRATQEGA